MDTPQIIAGRFRVEREIGRGGMGAVYRASQLGLERPVAIKILKQEFAAQPDVAERFMREARTMARLRHPRAAIIYDAGRLADGRPFIVMEYIVGSTLADALARERRFAPERAVRVASEICEVLSEAHSLGIVHRDLKPSNIMLNERGVSVLDFGIAKVLASSSEGARTHPTTESGVVIGTPRYMSPEQCLGHRVGPSSDLYSVGVLLYEMLAGRPPFTDSLSAAVLVKQATVQPPPLMSLRPDVPRPLALAVHTLLAKNPKSRPSSAEEVLELLRRSAFESERPAAPSRETDPLSLTIDALNTGGFTFARVASVVVILAILSTALLAWNVGAGERADRLFGRTTSLDDAASLAPRALSPRGGAPLTTDSARRIAASLERGRIREALPLLAGGKQFIAVVNDDPEDFVRLTVIERRGARSFRVLDRIPLDTEEFQGAKWTQEVADLDDDGYAELLCTGVRPGYDEPDTRRFVVYVPRTRQTYTLHVAPEDDGPAERMRATWSPNTMESAAALFRHALRRRATAF